MITGYSATHVPRFTAAMTIAAFVGGAPIATAQVEERQARIAAGIEEAVKAVEHSPRLKKLSPQAKRELIEFVLGNTMFVMGHEMGHILINEMGLPVLGKEEDAADSFAAVTALHVGTKFSERILTEAAKGWVLSSKRDKKEGNELAFYDEHGLDLQRAYNVVCLMVGSDRDKFARLAKESKLPEERQASCVRDYGNANWSWDLVLKPHRRSAEQPRIAIKIDYKEDDNDKEYLAYARILRHMGLLEVFADHAAERYSWRAPFSFEARTCGEPNATWNFGTRTMTLCYELLEEFAELFVGYSQELPARERRPASLKK